MKTLFNVEGVSRGVKIQFGFALLLAALSPIFSYWVYTLVDNVPVLMNIGHIWYIVFFQVLLVWLITKVYKQSMKLSNDSIIHILLLFCISPFIAFVLYSGDVTLDEIFAGCYVRLNLICTVMLMSTDVNYWGKIKEKYNSSK